MQYTFSRRFFVCQRQNLIGKRDVSVFEVRFMFCVHNCSRKMNSWNLKEGLIMKNVPFDIRGFTALVPWWRTGVPTCILCSENGIDDILRKIKQVDVRVFFLVDSVLEKQPLFAPLFIEQSKMLFNASASEPRTDDVDQIVEFLKSRDPLPDVIVGVGGGSTMDLAKAVGICLANPGKARDYQGYGMDLKKGHPVWVLPTLNGTGAEITPIAVLRGPEKKLGINHPYAAPAVAVIDPRLSSGVKPFNRFFTMMDCYFHHYEIVKSKTSSADAVQDARDGLKLATEVLDSGVQEYNVENAIKSAMASILGGSSTIGGRVGAVHAISYGLSNSAPGLPHSIAVTISMLALQELYPDGYEDTVRFLEGSGLSMPKASEYGIGEGEIEKMTSVALGMEKLWQSCFGEGWEGKASRTFVYDIYKRIVNG